MPDGVGSTQPVTLDPTGRATEETRLADREEQRAEDQRRDGEASISRWARRVHERSAQIHDRAAMVHRDAAERYAAQSG